MKALKIPKTKRVPGLFTYCTECQKRIGKGICGKSGKSIDSCSSKEKQIFKVSFKIPGTNSVRTKNLETRNLKVATKLAYEFREELEDNNYNQPGEPEEYDQQVQYMILIDTMGMYIDYLNNVGVPEHLQKQRTERHINDVIRTFNYFRRVLTSMNYNLQLFRVDEINQNIVGKFHHYLLEVKNYANKTYNKHIATLRHFINWLIEKRGYKISNPFIEVLTLPTEERNETIEQKEFEKLISVIIPENSKDTRVKYNKYYYKEWMASCFKIALYTGLRREEFLSLKWSSIEYNENNHPVLIKVPNFKVIRLKNDRNRTVQNIKWVPIIPELLKVLVDELGLERYRESDRYILAHDDRIAREQLPLFVSKAFSHFWYITGINRDVRLNDLRNTYITKLYIMLGDSAKVITDHADMETIKKHYMKAKLISETATDFKVFESNKK